jgi:hypothetical protein
MEIGIDIFEVFNEADLVAVSTKQGRELFVIHAAENGALANLEPVEMKDRKDGARLFGINVLDSVPGANEPLSELCRMGEIQGTNVAVGPVSASPSPTMQVTMRSGLSITAPNDTDRA